MENKEPKSDTFSEIDPLESFSLTHQGVLLDEDPTVEADLPIEDYICDITGRTRARPIETVSLCEIVGSAPADIAGSPIKKVQFEIGGGRLDEVSDNLSLKLDKMTLSQPTLPNADNSTASTPTRNRVDSRDYIVQASANIALLPSIAEEKQRNGIQYNKSISMVDSKLFSGTENSDKEVFGFVELDVLAGDGEISSREWKQIVRWIKYEEDLEEGSDRWGRPHIASLSFHSLIKLRQIIERDGIIMLDLEEKDMPGVAYRVVEELSSKGLIKSDESPLLMRALLLKHRHVQESDRSWFGLRRSNTASVVSLQSLYDDKARLKNSIPTSTDPSVLVRRNSAMQKSMHDMSASSRSLQRTASGNYLKPPGDLTSVEVKPINAANQCVSEEDLKWIQRKETKRLLPHGAEATMVMVGEFDAIRKPIFVFVRLSEASFMFNVTEIPVPARFFSILLVPPTMDIDFIEIGRSFGALMSNKHFYEIAMLASSRKNLLTGINEFLDDSIVLPPGDWDNHDLLPLHLLQAKSKAIRIRRMKKQHSFVRSDDSFCDGMNGLVMRAVDEQDAAGKSDPFLRTGRLFGGLMNDLKRRLPHYKSDIMDSFNFQCFSTIIFMYFASIGLIITFAGLMGEKTNNLIGMSETLVSTSAAGLFYSLIAGQPLIPIGPTGPLLVFDEILFSFCQRYNVEFLPARAWISIWLLLITLIVVAFEGSILVKWFTRFTQDIFAVLTALLLIFESVDNLVTVYEDHPLAAVHFVRQLLNHTNGHLFDSNIGLGDLSEEIMPDVDDTEELTAQPNTALLSTILMLGTFFIGYFLKEFRNSVFLGERARRALGDFGVPIAILTMVFLDYCATDTYTQKIKVPQGLEPSDPDERGWFISPMGIKEPFNMMYALGAILPALLIFILMFMSQQICELLVNRKERKLVKGSGFHLDMMLVAIINIFCGLFGAPWLCCATLRALAHVTALTVYSKNNPPGEKPSIVEVKEQRVTNFAVSLLVGFSVLLSPLLAFTPMAVLFGVFMYMGVSSLSSTQLFERFSLLFIPVASHPQTAYVRRVKTWKMHLFTMIQLGCLAVLWAVKSWKQISLAFPFFLVLLVPVRLQLKHVYNEKELEALDGDPSSK